MYLFLCQQFFSSLNYLRNYPLPKPIHTQTLPLRLLLKKDTEFERNRTHKLKDEIHENFDLILEIVIL